MAVPVSAQALVGAFSLGILATVSSASFMLFAWKHAARALRDGLRLALISFLALTIAWALTTFITTAVNSPSRQACQVSVVFSTIFDQLARFSVEQFLFWASSSKGTPKALQIGSQAFLLGRLGLAIAYTAFIRPAFNPSCVSQTAVPYLSVTLIIIDAVIVVLLAIRAVSTGATASSLSAQTAKQNKSVFLTIAGLAIWMGMSVTYVLGFDRTNFVFRTAIPATGATILILILMLFSGAILAEHDASRPKSPARSTSPTSPSVEAPPANYEELKRDIPNGLPFISRNADGTFPSISRPLQNEAAQPGFAQQQDMAPVELDARSRSPWARFFSNDARRAPPMPNAGQLTISRPVVHDDPNNEHNPLRRIQTIDLATARQQDQERRLAHAVTSPDLIATRPAPEPPRPSTAGGYSSAGPSNSIIRKKPVRATAPPGVLSPEPTDVPPVPKKHLDIESNAASTSMQLSPGVEAMRRRSPRHLQNRPVTLAAPPTTASRTLVPDVAPPVPFKFSTTPSLHAKGLPMNPRAMSRPAPVPRMQTDNSPAVMLVSDIVYKDPETVRTVLHKKAKSTPNFNKSAGSIVHRPRPIPRNKEDRQVFPAEASLGRGHRRSMSAGSIVTSKSILYVDPGNPRLLPPLPETPKSADTVRLSANVISNDSQRTSRRSVEPTRPSSAQERDAMVEDLRRAQDRLRHIQQQASKSGAESKSGRLSAATTKDSVRTMSIFGFEDNTQQQESTEDEYVTLGPATAKDLAHEDDSWRRKTQSDGRSSVTTHRSQRRSSPVIPDFDQLAFSPSESVPPTATTTWNMSAAVQMPVSKHQAHSTYIVRDKPASPVCPTSDDNPCVGEITVMLDDAPVNSASTIILTSKPQIESELGEKTPVQLESSHLGNVMPARFHRQLGDECPCFSTRKSALFKKRVPPPPPLPLSMRTRPVIIQTAEPSPVESPEETIRMIQQQLDNLDRPQAATEDNAEQGIALLADLEAEMGLQENRWQDMHNNLDRGSISTYASSPDLRSYPPSSVARSSIRDSQGSVYGAFLQPGRAQMPVRPSNLSNSLEYLSGSNKERLSQAEWYMQHSAKLSARSNGTTFTKITMADIGSPSPPDTNESDFEIELGEEFEVELDSPLSLENFPMVPESWAKLWRPREQVVEVVSRQLWVAPVEVPQTPDYFADLADIPVFVRTRRSFDEPLFISSCRLWAKPAAMKITRPGLWQKAEPLVVRSQSSQARARPPPRPLTVRPPRRPKRISQLADILESPKPLPNKRDTLGFFQFPWGEKSEHPVVFQRPGRLTAMPGTMSTGTSPLNAILEARAAQLAAQERAMQALADQQQASDATSPSARSDDEFDENTLWEIASLLRADQIPSRESLFPSLDGYEDEDDDFDMSAYEAEMLDEEDVDDETETDESEDDELPSFFEIVSRSPVSVVSSVHSPTGLEPEPSLLWDNTGVKKNMDGFGLEQPSAVQWSAYTQDLSDRPVFRHLNEAASKIESGSLWQGSSKSQGKTAGDSSLLWTTPASAAAVTTIAATVLAPMAAASAASLWTTSGTPVPECHLGLSQPQKAEWESYMDEDSKRPVFRHLLNEQHASIESQTLWSSPQIKAQMLDKKPSLWSRATNTPAPAQVSLWAVSKKSETVKRRPTLGLAHPEESQWQTYIKTGEERPLARQQPGELEILQSNAMWGLPESRAHFDEPEPILWGQVAASTPIAARDVTLWNKEAAIEQSAKPKGLFNASSQVKDRKRTSRELSTIAPIRAVAPRHEPVPQVESTSLWTKETLLQVEQESWMTIKPKATVVTSTVSSPVVRPAAVAKLAPATLWVDLSKAGESEDVMKNGLWTLRKVTSSSRIDSMSMVPFTAHPTRQTRMRQEPLPSITSNQLWAAPEKKAARRSTWFGYPAAHRPSSGHIAYTQLWSLPASASRKRRSELKAVWTRSIVQPSRVQSFAAEDDFFNHFGGAASRRQTLHGNQSQLTAQMIIEGLEEDELPPKPSNSSWLSTWGWKKSSD
ncbi:hypothetical protein Micbo1qcDRAFT_229562 [Microdochium bolleyi]|uniref:Uncharacterized protein n=1 Tax=Microdochium bolleyi TaxID=196109 RepID=A0A136JHW3_9PEZI|nr:hypothetical protein Micbo1qcDRAFT_229562 [Microdochium bolleyi]